MLLFSKSIPVLARFSDQTFKHSKKVRETHMYMPNICAPIAYKLAYK